MIHAVTPYGPGAGSSRVRVFEWLSRTEARWTVHCYLGKSNASPREVARHPVDVLRVERALRATAIARPEHLLLHREASPISRGHLETSLLARADLGVYDFDDALQWDDGRDGLVRRLAPKARKALAAVRAADRVIAGNAVLAEWASDHNPDVRIIPSCVSPSDYRQRATHELHDPPRLGWVGSRDNEAHLAPLGPVLEEVNRQCGARLVLFGAGSRGLGSLERLIDRVPWSEATVRASLADVDIGLMPVPSDRYSQGKCGYKLLQYAAAGIPFVASPVGVNSEILMRTGMPAAGGPAEWVDAIVDLTTRPAMARDLVGRRAREVVDRLYSYDAWQGRWEEAVGLRAAGTGDVASTVRGREA